MAADSISPQSRPFPWRWIPSIPAGMKTKDSGSAGSAW
jgi:hypothetical protein